MLMKRNKDETAVHGCHCPGDMAVRMGKVLARPWDGVRVCHLLLLFLENTLFSRNTSAQPEVWMPTDTFHPCYGLACTSRGIKKYS